MKSYALSISSAVLALSLHPAGLGAAAAQPACGSWKEVPVQQVGTDPILWDVDGAAPNDVWAVGAHYSPLAHVQIHHWDGASWTLVPDGGAALPVSALRSVTAIAADDVWAVGLFNTIADGTGPIQPLTQHWNGQAWTVVPAPQAGENGFLIDVDAAGPDDVWAVGNYSTTPGDLKALIQHWDGTAWTIVESPDVGAYHALNAVEAIAPDNVWAVGRMRKDNQWMTLVEHWDGTAWTVVASGTQSGGILNAVTAVAPDDIWAVGTATVSNTVVTMHWDGSTWSTVKNGLSAITLDGITATAPDDVWAVGTGPDIGPLTVHWDGQSWTPVPSVSGFTLHAARAFDRGDVWAVGQTQTESLTVHYSSDCSAR